jgi:3-phytase
MRSHILLSVALASVAGAQESVSPRAETTPVPSSGDAADDSVIWVDATDPSRSVVIGTDKESGLAVYDLAGNQLQFVAGGQPNNVDLRTSFPLDGERVTLVTTGDRSNNSIRIYVLDPDTRRLSSVAAGTISMGIDVLGCCMYRSPLSGEYYFMGTSEDGLFEQWRLFDDGQGRVDAELVRAFDVGGPCEGCVADDETAFLFIGEEAEGVWRYGAEPGAGTGRFSVDSTGGGNLTADVEGLTLYYASGGRGYLLVSSQGDDTFAVYERQSPHQHVLNFRIVDNSTDGIDGVTECDGIDVMNRSLGSAFPDGLFVAQDDVNPGGNQNFKLLSWRDIAEAAGPALVVDNSYVPSGSPDCTSIATFSYRNGSNPPLLTTSVTPLLGTTWQADLDCSGYKKSVRGYLFAYSEPAGGTFVAAGEVLVDLKSQRVFDLSERRHGRGMVVSFHVPIPADISLCGMEMSVQGMCDDRHSAGLSNAIDMVLGR